MRILIDATPVLLRSAGVKTYIYHWIQHLWHHAGNEQVLTFPPLNKLAALNHEGSMLGPTRTYSQLGLVYLANLQGNLPLLNWMTPSGGDETTGEESSMAVAMPVTMLVAPGPLVAMATPTPPVARA